MLSGSCHCGAASWSFEGTPSHATACNCTVCRRYGVIWIYGWEGEGVEVSGPLTEYTRGEKEIGFRFCPTCGCVLCWRAVQPDGNGRRRIAVNVRLAEPDSVADLPVRHFEGLVSFDNLPMDGRCVRDLWF